MVNDLKEIKDVWKTHEMAKDYTELLQVLDEIDKAAQEKNSFTSFDMYQILSKLILNNGQTICYSSG